MTNLNRRTFLSVAALATATATLAACGNNGTPGSGAAAGDYAAPPKDISAELTYAIWGAAQKPFLQESIDEFNKEYPNIKISIDVTPSKGGAYWTKIQTLASSNTLPDVFWMNGPKIKLYAQNDQLLPLDGIVAAKAVDLANYPQGLVDLYTVDGKVYGIPKDYDSSAIFYSKSLVAAAGVPEPTADWTWEDLKKHSVELSKFYEGKGIHGVTADLTGGQTSYYNTILGAGGVVITKDGKKSGYDSPEAIEGVQFWRDLIEAGASPSMQQITETYSADLFRSGKAAITMEASYEAGATFEAMGDDVKVVPLPKGPVSNQSVIHGLANVIPANSKNPDAARAFVAFLAGKKAAELQSASGQVISAFKGTQQAWVDALPGMGAQAFLDAAESASPYPASKNSGAWGKYEQDLLPPAFAGTKPVADSAKELATKMNEALAQEA
ncbi:ABC transporter substrate-binding protein [Arthrobacter sp. HY1533]|uniref:ABC transporter substrate-binding protein n=1 Tax=Arthrobacter sp. HY1533 TaxID=2970919 RepID=UPI0022B9D50C|nr:sugar ABC transporter substrate-binding protein [Arthrobacter sp. HY1533]